MRIVKKTTALLIFTIMPFFTPLAAQTDIDTTSQYTMGPGSRPIGEKWSRSPIYAEHGMAATAHPLASQVAIDILKSGGNAVDAAIAANATLGLMEPTGNGIGGDLFAIIWDPKTQQLYGLNASGRTPMGRSYEDMVAKAAIVMEGRPGIPSHGSLSVTVPGTVDGWGQMHQRFGKLPLKKVLAPAIDYAENGFPISPVIAMYWQSNFRRFKQVRPMIEEFENAQKAYLIDGAVPIAGQRFRNPDLANTLRQIGQKGTDEFYKGKLARRMDAYFRRIGGDLRYEDFAAHKSEWVSPGHVSYRGVDVYELPPNGQGYAALQMLSILKNVDLSQWERGSPEVLHYITEAKRLAFEDVAHYYADPDFSQAPLSALLTDEYGKQRFKLIDLEHAMTNPLFGEPKLEGDGDTTYLTIADKDGMMVSLIQSNYRGMGSGLVADGMGFMFQDRGELFSLVSDHPNVYAPGKRPFHTIIPAFVMKDGNPLMSFGLMGGAMQPQGHAQIIINIFDFGMNLQEAGDAARLNHDGGHQPTSVDKDPLGILYVEPGISQATVQRLRDMGHNVKVIDNGSMFGGYQAIWRNPETGIYTGATEMRKDGLAIGY
ncbi:MAG: gamma-glutamyltransferase [bacterium]